MLYSNRYENTGIYRADPTLPFYPTQQFSLIQFDVRYFSTTGDKVIEQCSNSTVFMISY